METTGDHRLPPADHQGGHRRQSAGWPAMACSRSCWTASSCGSASQAELPGRPCSTRPRELFSEHFGIRSIDELPNATELQTREVAGKHRRRARLRVGAACPPVRPTRKAEAGEGECGMTNSRMTNPALASITRPAPFGIRHSDAFSSMNLDDIRKQIGDIDGKLLDLPFRPCGSSSIRWSLVKKRDGLQIYAPEQEALLRRLIERNEAACRRSRSARSIAGRSCPQPWPWRMI